MVGVHLKNLGLTQKASGYDTVTVERLASEPLPAANGGHALFRQVHRIAVADGESRFTAITVNDASHVECSESGVTVHLVPIRFSETSFKPVEKISRSFETRVTRAIQTPAIIAHFLKIA